MKQSYIKIFGDYLTAENLVEYKVNKLCAEDIDIAKVLLNCLRLLYVYRLHTYEPEIPSDLPSVSGLHLSGSYPTRNNNDHLFSRF